MSTSSPRADCLGPELPSSEYAGIKVRRSRYNRDSVKFGVLHLGPGRFHRAHQASYFDRLLAHDPRWGIEVVSLRSSWLRETLARQQNEYTLTTRGKQEAIDLIRSIIGVSVLGRDRQRVMALMEDRGLKLITLTITEAGYHLLPNGRLNLDAEDVRRDLVDQEQPLSAVGLIVEGLRRRRSRNLASPAILSCDNLRYNGDKLRQACVDFAQAIDPDLAAFVASSVAFPNCVVDAITPETPGSLASHVGQVSGIRDAAPILREPYCEWIIEDSFPGERPPLDLAGAVFVQSIKAAQDRKLRLLNASHTLLAIYGLSQGKTTVSEAAADGGIFGKLSQVIEFAVLPTLAGTPAENRAYIEHMLERFTNPFLAHPLEQIIVNSSAKFVERICPTIAALLELGERIDELVDLLITWVELCANGKGNGIQITDPAIAGPANFMSEPDLRSRVASYVGDDGLFPQALASDKRFAESLAQAIDRRMLCPPSSA